MMISICNRTRLISRQYFTRYFATANSGQQNASSSALTLPPDFHIALCDFLPEPLFDRRNALREKMERREMLNRRIHLDVPLFYVGSILAVTLSDRYAQARTSRFVGICISRELHGLRHHFTLRNILNGQGIEIRYDLYNPLILNIQVLKLEKRLDDHLLYLRDALPEYSTFPMDMQAIPHPVDKPAPLNDLKVELRPPPWTMRWEAQDLKGLQDFWELMTPWYKRKFFRTRDLHGWWEKYDLIKHDRINISREDQMHIYKDMLEFEANNAPIYRNARKALFHCHGRKAPPKVDQLQEAQA